MNLSNFEEFINEVILERGKNYFRLGRYKLMHCIDNQFTYQVYGTRNYTSKVTFKAGSLHSYACDCPYDMGPICKHIVCVLYDIKENRRDDSDIGLSNIDELLDGFSESKMRNELKKLLELNPTYLQKLLFKHGYFNADSISDLVSRAFYAANIDCDDYDYVELDDFSDILIGVVKKIEKSHSLAEMILITKDIKQEVEDLFISFYGFSDYLDDNETYYFPEFVETYLYQYRDNKSEEDIELIVDTYVDEFIDTVDYHKNYIPVGILYSLMQFNYSQYAVNKIDEIISDIQENAINADPFKRSDLLTQPPKLYSAYKRKALKQNKILLTLDHFLYDYAIKKQDKGLTEDIMNRNFLLDTSFFEKKVSSLMNHQIYDELEVLLKSDFSHRLPIFQLEDMKEDLYKKM
ncbi:MAG TPA: hypothetical protein VJ878_01920, partial [Candidatus Izemoplasmatales bacterium]|nr:hypothetical protein [Candidatus Izemoplasmatales bacterium]